MVEQEGEVVSATNVVDADYELFVRGLIQEYLRYFRICWREWIFPATERASIVCINHNGAEEEFT